MTERCGLLKPDGFRCGRDAAAVYRSPNGTRAVVCARHDGAAARRYARRYGWTRSEASQSVTQPRGASQAVGAA